MITRIVTIRNIGKFVSCGAGSDVTFRKLTLIFGENGRGKTTMGDILRSLSSGNPEYIIGRRTLGTEIPPFAQILLDGNTMVNFKDGTWDGPGPRLAIYDSTFVDENVHSGNSIDSEHRKNLYGVIVGEEGVALAKKVDDYDARLREVAKDITSRGEVVKAYLPQGFQLEGFLDLSQIAGLDGAVAAKQDEIAALERAKEITEKAALGIVTPPKLPPNYESLLAKTLPDISKEAEVRVKQHLESHARPGGEKWIAHGLSLSGGAQCPFCGQSIEGLDLVDAYRRYFSESYAEFKRELSALHDLLAQHFGEAALLPPQRVLDANSNLAAFWVQFVAAELPPNPFEVIQKSLSNMRDAALSRLKAKLASPLEIIPADLEYDRALEAYGTSSTIAAEYSTAVAAVNERIAAKKKELGAANLTGAKAELNRLLSVRKRFEIPVDDACRRYSGAVAGREALTEEKASARRKVDAYCKEVLTRYEKRINELLDVFGAGFRIGETKTSLAGGTVRTSFQIIINKVAVDLGGPDTPKTKACFRNTLSSGDRSTLALAFFIAKLENDPMLAETVVLFDDPFTSQDQSRRLRTQLQIRKLAGVCRQVIVFSHDAMFLKQIVDRQPSGETKVLQFFTTGPGHSRIGECEIADLTSPEYVKDYYALHKFLHHSEGDSHLVAPAIRRLLETYLRMKQPKVFQPTDWLGDMIGKIRQSGPGNPLHHAHPLLEHLDAINQYSQRFHHGESTETVAVPIDPDELRTYIRQTFRVVGGF